MDLGIARKMCTSCVGRRPHLSITIAPVIAHVKELTHPRSGQLGRSPRVHLSFSLNHFWQFYINEVQVWHSEHDGRYPWSRSLCKGPALQHRLEVWIFSPEVPWFHLRRDIGRYINCRKVVRNRDSLWKFPYVSLPHSQPYIRGRLWHVTSIHEYSFHHGISERSERIAWSEVLREWNWISHIIKPWRWKVAVPNAALLAQSIWLWLKEFFISPVECTPALAESLVLTPEIFRAGSEGYLCDTRHLIVEPFAT